MIIFKYSLFAILAIMTNLITQETVYNFYSGPYKLEVSILIGTIVGLLIKYILDKKYIFYHKTYTVNQNFTNFLMYSGFSVLTTVIFWGTEYAFDYIFGTKVMRYTGAIIGLTIGYIVKYQLDKKFVFKKERYT